MKTPDQERCEWFMRGWKLGECGFEMAQPNSENTDYADGHAFGEAALKSAETAAAGRYNLDFLPARAGAEQTPTSR